jgi:hypothetical protein
MVEQSLKSLHNGRTLSWTFSCISVLNKLIDCVVILMEVEAAITIGALEVILLNNTVRWY